MEEIRNILRRLLPKRLQNIFSNLGQTEPDELELTNIPKEVPPIQLNELICTKNVLEIERIEIFDCKIFQEIHRKLEQTGENIKFLTIHIDADSSVVNQENLHVLAEKCSSQSIVLLIKSKTNQHLKIFWKLTQIQHFLTFKHYSTEFSERDEIIYDFIGEFIAGCLSKGHSGISKEVEITSNLKEVELKQLANSYGLQLIHIASSEGKVEIVKILLSLGCKTESIIKGLNAQICAMANGRSKVLLLFAQNNFIYPENIDPTLLSNEFNEFYKTTEELHEAIKSKDNGTVSQILESDNHKLKFYFNYQNQSAAQIAINNRDFDIYENLIIHDVFLSPHEIKNDFYDQLDLKTKRAVREIHKKWSKDHPENHINILMTNTYSAHDSINHEQSLELVKEAYKDLSKNNFCDAMLRIVAASKRTELYYDFMRSTVNGIDPTTTSHTKGIFYPRGQIFIGAKLLLEESTRNKAMAVMAHELCHCAMNLVYRNDARPYKDDDEVKKKEFEKINEICERTSGTDEIIDVIYDCYPKEVHHAELIVRYCHSEILYKDDHEKLEKNRRVFKELWKFAENTVHHDMIKAIPEVKSREKLEIAEMSEKISKLRRTVIFTILIALVVVLGLTIAVYLFLYKPNYSFHNLNNDDKIRVKKGIVRFKNVEVMFSDLFTDNSTAYLSLTADHITQIFDNKPLDLSSPHCEYLNNFLVLNWVNLTERLKSEILSKTFSFQNESIKYDEFEKVSQNSLKFLTSNELVKILSNYTLKVGVLISNNTEFYVERASSRRIDILNLGDFYRAQGKFYPSWVIPDSWIAKYYLKNIAKEKSLNWTELIVKQSFPDIIISRKEKLFDSMNEALASKFMILSDEAGSGKTVTFRDLTIRIKKNYPTRWVSYVDLKDFTKFYNSSGNLEDLNDLLENILDLKLKSKFEREVFKEMFSLGRVVLLWNGFDEISPSFNKFIEKVMVSIFINSKNVQFVCTRPLYAEQLENTFNSTALGLFPYTIEEEKEFLEKYFMFKNVSKNQIEGLVDKAYQISAKQKFTTPLMLRMIAEINEDDISLNLYDTYKSFVAKKIDIWQEKSSYAKKLLKSFLAGGQYFDIMKIYQKFALLSVFSTSLNVKKLAVMKIKLPENFPFYEITRMGILYINTDSQFEFAHKTFAEFFAAQYFIENLYLIDDEVDFNEDILILFYYLWTEEGIANFLINFLDTHTSKTFNSKIGQLLMFKHKNMLIEMLYTGRTVAFEMLFKLFSKDKRLLAHLLKVDEDETLYTAIFNYPYGALEADPSQIKEFGRKFLAKKEFESFINGRNQKGKILFGMAFYKVFRNITKHHFEYNLDSFNLSEDLLLNFFENIRGNLTEGEQNVLLMFLVGNPKVFYRLDSYNFSYFENTWVQAEEILSKIDLKIAISMALSTAKDFGGFKDVQNYAQIVEFLFSRVDKLMENSEIYEMFKDEKLLHKATFSKEIFNLFWNFFVIHSNETQQKEILKREDYYGRIVSTYENGNGYFNFDFTPFKILHFSLLNRNEVGSFEIVAEIYEKFFNKTELQNIILKSNDFMPWMMKNIDKMSCEKIFKFFKRIFRDNEKILCDFINSKIGKTNFSIFEYFHDLKLNVDENLKIFERLGV